MQLISLKIFVEACDGIKKLNISIIISNICTGIDQILCVIWHTQVSLWPKHFPEVVPPHGVDNVPLTCTNQCFFLLVFWPEV